MDRKATWVRVTKAAPCPVCGRPDWCGRSADGVVVRCTRIESPKASTGRDGSSAWIHRLTEPLPPITPTKKPAKVSRIEWARRAAEMFKHPQAEKRREELSALLGVSVQSLVDLEVGVGFDYDGNWFWAFPERDVRWCPVGIKRRYPDGAQKHMPGATPGLYMVRDWWLNPGPVFLPEGGSDTAALLTMGLCAVGRSSNTGSIERLIGLLMDCTHKPVVVLGENDRKPERVGTSAQCPKRCKGCSWCWPGRYGAMMTADRLTQSLGRTCYHRMVADAKDTREWVGKFGAEPVAFVTSLGVPKSWLKSIDVLATSR